MFIYNEVRSFCNISWTTTWRDNTQDSGVRSLKPTAVLLIRVVAAVVEPIAFPELRLTAVIFTLHLRRLTLCRDTKKNNMLSIFHHRLRLPLKQNTPQYRISRSVSFTTWIFSRGSDSRQLSSSLPSPQSLQPSQWRVWLMHRLLRHWNLPGQAVESHRTDKKIFSGEHVWNLPLLGYK